MLLLQLLLTSLLLPHFTLSAGVCYADRPGTCSGTNHFFQCIHDQSGCSSAPTSHKASVLPVSSWTGLDVCTNQDDTITGPCKMLRPKLATGDLNGDGLTDIVVASQLGGSDYSNIRTQYEILLLVNTGVPGTPSFTTVLRDATTPYVDPFKDIRDGQGDCGCNGGTCCKDYFRKDMFDNRKWDRGFSGLMRGMSVQLVDLVGNDGNADGLLDLVLGNICYRNIGTASWPRYHESHKTILRGFDETLPSSSPSYNTVNIAISYHFVDFDQDGDQDAMVTDNGLEGGRINMFRNNGNAGTPSFDYWGPGTDERSSPHISEKLYNWGGDIAVADFDGDGLVDVLVGQDALFSNRGSSAPKLKNLGLGTELFGTAVAMSRADLQWYALHPYYNFTGGALDKHVSLLYIKPGDPGDPPQLYHSTQIVARDEPAQEMTPWRGKRDFASNDGGKNFQYGKSGWYGVRLSNAGDMNGDGLADWITNAGRIFLQQSSTSTEDPAFQYWGDAHQIPTSGAPGTTLDLDTEITNLPSNTGCTYNGVHSSTLVYSPGDVDGDGLMDLFVGAGNSYSNCAWPTNPNVYEHFRLTYLKNIGTITNPIWQRIKHGHAGYPLGNVIFSSKYESKAVTPVLGDVNGDGHIDLLVSQQGATNDMWNFDSARLFLNNGDGTFVENTNMLPTNEELRNSNAPSPLYTDNGMFVPLTLVDFTNEGFADLYFSSGNARTTGALFKNKKLTDPNSNQWNAIKTTDSIVLGEKTVSNSGCGSDSTHPIGHVFFDGPNQVAWRVYPTTTNLPVVQMYTMLPRCKLPSGNALEGGTTCGVGFCSKTVPDVLYGLTCQCPSSYLGSSTNDPINRFDNGAVLPIYFNDYCRTCTTGATNSDPVLDVCTSCAPGFWSNTTYSASDPFVRTPNLFCTPCGPGRVGPETQSNKESGCLSCPSGKHSQLVSATTMEQCLDCSPGQYSVSRDATCRQCPFGQIQPLSGQPACQKCSSGQFQQTAGSNSCVSCPTGTFTNVAGATSQCIDCAVGFSQQLEGQALCFPCVPGEYQNVTGAQSCEKCGQNTFTNTSGRSSCYSCRRGTKAEEGSARCFSCDAGEAGTGIGGSCQQCAAGQSRASNDATTDSCTRCNPGYYQKELGQASCLPCIPGTYQEHAGSTACVACSEGQHQRLAGNDTCLECDPGQYMKGNGAVNCLDCNPGDFQHEKGAQSCEKCGENTFTNTSGRSSCYSCRRGAKAEEGSARCSSCDAGEAGTGSGGTCQRCAAGQSRASSDATTDSCTRCKSGYYQKELGQASCLPCIPGEFQDARGQTSCKQCPENTYNGTSTAISCGACVAGKFSSKGATTCQVCIAGKAGTPCTSCTPGKYRAGSDVQAAVCHSCIGGYYQDQHEQASCLACLPGRFQTMMGQMNCMLCPRGQLQTNGGQMNCNPVPPGKIVGTGSSSFITVPPGQFITGICEPNDADCNPFAVCPEGTTGTEDRMHCEGCPIGLTSLPGATTCQACSKGKFNALNGTTCVDCPAGYFQEQEIEPSARCLKCPAGWTQDKSGETACKSLGWPQAEDCGDDEFLNNTDAHPGHWKCLACPAGASCRGHVSWREVKALFGWARCKSTIDGKQHDRFRDSNNVSSFDKFERCSFPAACLGAENKDLEADFVLDTDDMVRNESCSVGYLDPSRMCHACAEGYSHDTDMSGRCSKCPEKSANLLAAIFGCLAGLFGLGLYLFMVISDGGVAGYGDALKIILLNYIQMLHLLSKFPIEWPEIFSVIFQVGGAITSLGQHVVNLKCMMDNVTDAEIFYMQAIAWAFIPLVLITCLGCFWTSAYCINRINTNNYICNGRLKFHDAMIKWEIAVVAVLYLLYPTLCGSSFGLFACRTVCNDGKLYLRADLEEECFLSGGRHEFFAFMLGLPMLLLYVFGLPLVAYFFVYRLRKRAIKVVFEKKSSSNNNLAGSTTRPRQNSSTGTHTNRRLNRESMQDDGQFKVLGLLFSVFREDTWFWEITICWRKVVLAAIGVFGAQMGELQIHVTSCFLMFIILVTAVVRPFEHGKRGTLIQGLELASLVAIWLTLWAGAVFISYPKCKLLHGSARNSKDWSYDQLTSTEEGDTLDWCTGMAITTGLIDTLVVMSCVVLLLHDCYTKRQKSQAEAVLMEVEMLSWMNNPGNRSQRSPSTHSFSSHSATVDSKESESDVEDAEQQDIQGGGEKNRSAVFGDDAGVKYVEDERRKKYQRRSQKTVLMVKEKKKKMGRIKPLRKGNLDQLQAQQHPGSPLRLGIMKRNNEKIAVALSPMNSEVVRKKTFGAAAGETKKDQHPNLWNNSDLSKKKSLDRASRKTFAMSKSRDFSEDALSKLERASNLSHRKTVSSFQAESLESF